MTGMPKGSGRISLFIKSINVMLSSSSHKIGLGLSLFSKAYKNLDIREKKLESNFSNNQTKEPQETSQLALSFRLLEI